MPKQPLVCHQLSLPLTPTSSPPQRPSSYSRALSRQHRTQFTLIHSSSRGEKGLTDPQSLWSKNLTYYSSIGKDDMMRVLKGTNYLLSCHQLSKKDVRNVSLQGIYRTQVKNMTDSTQNHLMKRVSRVRRQKLSDARLLTLDRQRFQNEKKFLMKNLRMEKWLLQAENRVI